MARGRKRLVGTAAIAIVTLGSALGVQVASADSPETLPAPPGIENAFLKFEDQIRSETGRYIPIEQLNKATAGLAKIEDQFNKFFPTGPIEGSE